eukprot:CAMPEP_0117428350 /NCGR_PEP_ID=MMETSP0758-20121206/8085_1 /TAXON_ID=63605 /ORGANISM="Percolomonas cosmopolitus, Strain AE-1 (ATCC 50343)" /LENGTH=589 /DNA_ID=CAMNT_0005214673 /DNA_START=189 /DNA_END=1954 /DNA_ORIENTATION=+
MNTSLSVKGGGAHQTTAMYQSPTNPSSPTATPNKFASSSIRGTTSPTSQQGASSPSKSKKKKKVKRLRVFTKLARNRVVHESIRSLKWYETHDATEAEMLWVETTTKNHIFHDYVTKSYQKINRFPHMGRAVGKYYFAKCLNRMAHYFPDDYTFVPETYLFPDDLNSILDSPKKRFTGKTYIIKPSQGSQGNGIFLTQNLKKTVLRMENKFRTSHYVIQEYLPKPYLVDGYKFDLRIYILIVSLSPLKIYIFKDGLVRMCTQKYEAPTAANLDASYMHLSNYSLNKQNDKFEDTDSMDKGSKRNFAFLNDHLRKDGKDPALMWNDIQDLIVKTIIAISPIIQAQYRSIFHHGRRNVSSTSQCFQVLGFDVFLDHTLKPWVIEGNHHPSFNLDSAVDASIKRPCVVRAMKVVAFDILYRKLSPTEREDKRPRYEKMYCQGWKYIDACDLKENKRLMIFSCDQLLDAFITSCGVRSHQEMVASKFYKFARDYGIIDARKVSVGRHRITRVELDLMFIDAQKRTGLPYMNFEQWLDALIVISKKLYQPKNKERDDLQCFLKFLNYHILNHQVEDSESVRSASSSRSTSSTSR